ncbi:MAG TPA: hypothetical protein VG816_04725 [Solirubrobacterales bacterium]|nr:hypothetical protein [Solirubrobacterales bacterium]
MPTLWPASLTAPPACLAVLSIALRAFFAVAEPFFELAPLLDGALRARALGALDLRAVFGLRDLVFDRVAFDRVVLLARPLVERVFVSAIVLPSSRFSR